MIEYRLTYKDKSKTAYLYHDWDVEGRDVVGWDCTKDDVGKFIRFDDGSNLHAKIIGVSDEAVRTEVGVFRRDDIVHCCIPKWHNANYSGVLSKEEHPFVRPYSHREKGTVTRLLKGEDIPGKFITPRIKMFTLERLREEVEKYEMTNSAGEIVKADPQYYINQIIAATQNPNGRNFAFAMKVLARLYEIDAEKITDKTQTNTPLLGGVNKALTRKQDASVVGMNLKTMKAMVRDIMSNTPEEAEIIKDSDGS